MVPWYAGEIRKKPAPVLRLSMMILLPSEVAPWIPCAPTVSPPVEVMWMEPPDSKESPSVIITVSSDTCLLAAIVAESVVQGIRPIFQLLSLSQLPSLSKSWKSGSTTIKKS